MSRLCKEYYSVRATNRLHAVNHHVTVELQRNEPLDGKGGRISLEPILREVDGEVAQEAADAANHFLCF